MTRKYGETMEEIFLRLERMADDNRQEFRKLGEDKRSLLKETLTLELIKRISEPLERIKIFLHEGEQLAAYGISKMDKELRRNPWSFLGTLSVISLIAGITLRKARR